MARLQDQYKAEIVPKLKEKFGYRNVMQVPRLSKVVVNMGLGDAIENVKVIETAAAEIGIITGQKPVVTKARKSIANFKLREGVPIGVMVTLRRDSMYHFLDKLIAIALPRVRDFKGVSPRGFDGRGNYTLGIKEQIMFPEVNYDKIDKIRGMNITIVTTARTDEEGLELLRLMGMPFRAYAREESRRWPRNRSSPSRNGRRNSLSGNTTGVRVAAGRALSTGSSGCAVYAFGSSPFEGSFPA